MTATFLAALPRSSVGGIRTNSHRTLPPRLSPLQRVRRSSPDSSQGQPTAHHRTSPREGNKSQRHNVRSTLDTERFTIETTAKSKPAEAHANQSMHSHSTPKGKTTTHQPIRPCPDQPESQSGLSSDTSSSYYPATTTAIQAWLDPIRKVICLMPTSHPTRESSNGGTPLCWLDQSGASSTHNRPHALLQSR